MDHYLIPSFSPINCPRLPPPSAMSGEGWVAFKLGWASTWTLLKRAQR